ncbi:FAT domain-containing protein [Aphelenchoides besseyi]|nr:FAT domain-containing protein [Aphelenchoides besseyi]
MSRPPPHSHPSDRSPQFQSLPSNQQQQSASNFNSIQQPGGHHGHVPGQAVRSQASSSSHSSSQSQQESTPFPLRQLLQLLVEGPVRERIDQRLNLLRRFYDNYDEVTNTAIYSSVAQQVMDSLLRIIRETNPHFCLENETQASYRLQLRKTAIEILLRSSLELLRTNAKEILILLLDVVANDNEENALLSIKILTEVFKLTIRQQSTEINKIKDFFQQIKKSYTDFLEVVERPNFFRPQPSTFTGSVDEEIQRSINTLYTSRTIHVRQQDEKAHDFTISPRSSLSVRVYAELPSFMMLLIHSNKMTTKLHEMMPILIRYISIVAKREATLDLSLIDEFHASQIRSLNFMAYMSKYPQLTQLPIYEENLSVMVDSINNLFELLNPQVTTSRRELMIAIKIFLQCEHLRPHFVKIIPRITSDRFLLGETLTSQDSLRNFLYSQLVDLLHHLRMNLTYDMLLHVYKLCIRCIHDSQLFPTYQTMYAKLTMNLCEPLARDVLMSALRALTKKAEIIAKYYLPQLLNAIEKTKREAHTNQLAQSTATTQSTTENLRDSESFAVQSTQQRPPMDMKECRSIIRIIVQASKVICYHLGKCHLTENSSMDDERRLYSNLFVYVLRSFDVFRLVAQHAQSANQMKFMQKDEVEIMEMFASIFIDVELSIFKRIFSEQVGFFIDRLIANPTIHAVSNQFLDEKRKTSTVAGSILMRHMLRTMPDMVSNHDITQVYLRIFKQIFAAVSRSGQLANAQRGAGAEAQQKNSEHEQMLMPFLHQIVAKSTQLALRSREPPPYFHLLRALFRSIGTGSHDHLYQQFLPLLPSILQQLNRFQNGSHKQPIHELFVELCLTVPVRLSSLLPYLPLLMDPLVCALHGTPPLVQQGLRTLELCVDNLQPDYFYDHMSPVRADLMKGLWRALYTQDQLCAMSALRIMGKLGGSSRRAFLDPQKFDYVDHSDKSIGARGLQAAHHPTIHTDGTEQPPHLCIKSTIELADRHRDASGGATTITGGVPVIGMVAGTLKRRHEEAVLGAETPSDALGPKRPHMDDNSKALIPESLESKTAISQQKEIELNLPAAHLVETAVWQIRLALPFLSEPFPPIGLNWAQWTSGVAAAQQSSKLPHQNAVELCRSVLLNSFAGSPLLSLNHEKELHSVFKRAVEKYKSVDARATALYKRGNAKSRAVLGNALSGLFYAVVSPDLCQQQLPVYRAIVGHLTMQALLESLSYGFEETRDFMDGSLLIDVICQSLSDSCKEFSQAGIVALRYINVVTRYVFNTNDWQIAYKLSFFGRLLRSISNLCYRRDWYAKLGGCTALRFFMEDFPSEFVIDNVQIFINAFFTTIASLADEVSSGALDGASKGLDQLLDVCFNCEDSTKRDRIVEKVIVPLVVQNLSNAETQTRNEANRLLQKTIELSERTEKELMTTEQTALRQSFTNGFVDFASMSASSQIGFLEFFANHLDSAEFGDLEYANLSANFVANLMFIVENTDVALHAMPSARYAVTNLTGGAHNLEEQIKPIRSLSIQSLRTHSKKLLDLKQKADEKDHSKLLESLEMVVNFLLKIVLHYAHPLRSKCKSILQMIIDSEPRFKELVKKMFDGQFKQMHPYVQLNESLSNPMAKLNFLEPIDRLRLFPHTQREQPTAAGEPPNAPITDTMQTTIFVDLNDPTTLEELMNGPIDVKIKDPDGNVVAVGRSLGFAPIMTKDEEERLTCGPLNTPKTMFPEAAEITSKSLAGDRSSLKSNSFQATTETMDVDIKQEIKNEEQTEKTIETEESKREEETKIYVVKTRKPEGGFQLAKYEGRLPPRHPGTFIVTRTLNSGLQVRSVRNYNLDIGKEMAENETVRQQIAHRIAEVEAAEAAEMANHPESQQIGSQTTRTTSQTPGSYSAVFSDSEEAAAAHLEIANMLMLEAQSLGLDQPSHSSSVHARGTAQKAPASTRPTTVVSQRSHLQASEQPKGRRSSGVSAPDFQDLMEFNDSDFGEIGEEIIRHLPDFPSPGKTVKAFVPQQMTGTQFQPPFQQPPARDPVQEVVESMRADALAAAAARPSQQSMETGIVSAPASVGSTPQRQQQSTTYAPSPYGSNLNYAQNIQTMSAGQPLMPPVSQSVSYPTTPRHVTPSQYPQQAVISHAQFNDPEDGLDAEYAIRQQQTTSGYPAYEPRLQTHQPMAETTEISGQEGSYSAPASVPMTIAANAPPPNVSFQSSLASTTPRDKADDQDSGSGAISPVSPEIRRRLSNASDIEDCLIKSITQKTKLTVKINVPVRDGRACFSDAQATKKSSSEVTSKTSVLDIRGHPIDLEGETKETQEETNSIESFEMLSIEDNKKEDDIETSKPEKETAESEDEFEDLDDTEIVVVASDSPQPYDHVTNEELRDFLNTLHKQNPERAAKAVDFYNRQMTKLIEANSPTEIEVDEQGLRLEYTTEEVRLPTGHTVKMIPKTQFNFMPVELMHELRKMETESLSGKFNDQTRLTDEEVEEMIEFHSVSADKLSTLADLRELSNLTVPTELLEHLTGEVSQLFKYTTLDECNAEQLGQVKAILRLISAPEVTNRPFDFICSALVFCADVQEALDVEGMDELLFELARCLNSEAEKSVDFILRREFLEVVSCRRMALEICAHEETADLRSELLKKIDVMRELLFREVATPFVDEESIQTPWSENAETNDQQVSEAKRAENDRPERNESSSSQLHQLDEAVAHLQRQLPIDMTEETLQQLTISNRAPPPEEPTESVVEQSQTERVEEPMDTTEVPVHENKTDKFALYRQLRNQIRVDFAILQLLSVISEKSTDEFVSTPETINLVHDFWRSKLVLQRYSARRSIPTVEQLAKDGYHWTKLYDSIMTEEKFAVPELCVQILVHYLKLNPDRVDILHDCCAAFCHDYITDFNFLQKHIEEEIVPNASLEWQRLAFMLLIKFFRPRSVYPIHESNLMAKFMHYVIIPCYQYAFNTRPVNDVVGAEPNPAARAHEQDERSIIWLFCRTIINPYYERQTTSPNLPVSSLLIIELYYFCALLVQNCADHIHNNNARSKEQEQSQQKTGQGLCLTQFMLFGWPCLQPQYKGDSNERYAGQFLIANLIEKFTISWQIVLQTVKSLLTAHQPDLRDVVRKSIDIIIPVICNRSSNNDQQLFNAIKSVAEESHNPSQIIHCIGVITRQYKAFFRLRRESGETMLRFIQRQLLSSVEAKKLILDVCETMIKWEQHRQKLLESTETSDQSPTKTQQHSSMPLVEVQNLQERFNTRIIEQVLIFLLRIATTQETGASAAPAGADILLRRALILLSLAVKPHIFGHVPLRVDLLVRLLNEFLKQEEMVIHEQQQSGGQMLPPQQRVQPPSPALVAKVTQTIDVIAAITGFLVSGRAVDPKEMIPSFLRDLQLPLGKCLNGQTTPVAQSIIKLIGKLVENSRTSPNGLDDFEDLNTEMCRYINETFGFIALNGFSARLGPAQSLQTISTCLSLVRVVCKQQPAFLDTVCFNALLKVFKRLVQEYQPATQTLVSTIGQTGNQQLPLDQREKNHQEILYGCLDTMHPRLTIVWADARRSAVQSILPLMEKSLADRLIEKILDILNDVIRMDVTLQPNFAIDLLYRVSMSAQKTLHSRPNLMGKFLTAVYAVFEDRGLRRTEIAQKLQFAFFWGLSYQYDRNIRHQFYCLFESHFPDHVFDRLLFVLTEQNWLPVQNQFWIPMCLNLLLRSSIGVKSNLAIAAANSTETKPTVARLQLTNCALFSRSGERLFELCEMADLLDANELEMQVDAVNRANDSTATTPLTDLETNGSLDPNSEISANELVIKSGKILSDLINNTKLEDLARHVIELTHSDVRLARSCFVEFFSSIWNQMHDASVERRTTIAHFFLVSGILNSTKELAITPLNCFYEAFTRSRHPIPVDSSTLEYIAAYHKGWYTVIERMENEIRKMRTSRQIMNETQSFADEIRLMDSLSELYERLGERDLLAALWKKRACLDGTVRTIMLFNQGLIYDCRLQSRIVMEKGRALLLDEQIIEPPTLTANESKEAGSRGTPPIAMQPDKIVNEQSTTTVSSDSPTPGTTATTSVQPAPPPRPSGGPYIDVRCIDGEMRLLERHWVQSCRELNDWSTLERWSNSSEIADAEILAAAAWHQSEWALVRELIPQIEAAGTKRCAFEAALLNAQASVARGTDISPYSTSGNSSLLPKQKFEELYAHLITEWRSLSPLVCAPHAEILRSAQRIQEVTEANQIAEVAFKKFKLASNAQSAGSAVAGALSRQFDQLPHRYVIDNHLVGEIKQTTKTWRNRPLTVLDPISHWSDTFTARVQQYMFIMRVLENGPDFQQTQVMLPQHSIAQSQINLARTLRKAGFYDEAIHELATLHSLNQVYPVDANMIVIEEAKSMSDLASTIARRQRHGEDCVEEHQLQFDYGTRPYERDLNGRSPAELRDKAVNLMNAAHFEILPRELAARFYATKGSLLTRLAVDEAMETKNEQLNETRMNDANQCFVIACQLVEAGQLAPQAAMNIGLYVWKHWSRHLETKFTNQIKQLNRSNEFNVELCRSARSTALETLVALLECLRTATDQRAKKLGARFFHLLNCVHVLDIQLKSKAEVETDDSKLTVDLVLKRHAASVPPVNWTEKIVNEIRSYESEEMTRILCSVAEAYPQQVLVVLRTIVQPELVTKRIEYVQRQLPLIDQWIRCAPPLDGEEEDKLNTKDDEKKTEGSWRKLKKAQWTSDSDADSTVKWLDLVLTAVDSMCINRHADVKAMNTILNELDEMPMEWSHFLYSELVTLAEQIHSETFNLLSSASPNSNPAELKSPTFVGELISKFVDLNLKSKDDEMEIDAKDSFDRRIRARIFTDLKELEESGWPLIKLAQTLCQWLNELQQNLKSIDNIVPLRDLSPYLSSFNGRIAQLDICSNWTTTKTTQFTTQIAQFLPLTRQVFQSNGVARMFSILSQNGKVYTYILQRRAYSVETTQLQQIFVLLNSDLLKSREVCNRNAQFPIVDLIYTGRNYQLIECSPMCGASSYQLFTNAERYGANLLSMTEIAEDSLRFRTTNAERPSLWQLLEKNYEQIVRRYQESKDNAIQIDVEPTSSKPELPNNLFTSWMQSTYPDTSTYWMIRKRLATQWALYAAAELAIGLQPMSLGGMLIDLNSAQLFAIGAYKFALTSNENSFEIAVDKQKNRLTPNIAEYLQVDFENEDETVKLSGHLEGTYIAITRALSVKSYATYLRAMIWDLCRECKPADWTTEQVEERALRAALELPDFLAERLRSRSVFTSHGYRALNDLQQAAKQTTWCEIDLAQHPWF